MVQISDSKNYGTNEESRQLMNSILSNAYELEWQRTRDIESKACNIVGFTGIIFTLIIGTLSSILVADKGIIIGRILFSHWYSKIVIIVVLSLMVLSMYYGIKALSVKDWKYPIAQNFVAMFKKSSEASILKQELIGSINRTYSDCIEANEKLNDKIASYIKYSHVSFLLSIILIAIYFVYVLNIFF